MNDESFAAIDALAMYWNNMRPLDIVEAVYTDPIGKYLDEKVTLCTYGCLADFWAQLDTDHRRKLAELAWEKYGDAMLARL